jgi:hypothetical protein
MDWTWDLALVASGFSLGVLCTLGGLLVARMRRQAAHEGDRFVHSLGPVARGRFLDAVGE